MHFRPLRRRSSTVNPLVVQLERTGLGRVPAALIVVVLAVLFAVGVGWGLFTQMSALARAHRA